MINENYQIWTMNGWIDVKELENGDEIMVFDFRIRMSKFKTVENLKKVKSNDNIHLSNHNFDIIVNKNSCLLQKDYSKSNVDEIQSILCDAKMYWAAFEKKLYKEFVNFINFDLQDYEFVFIKNGIYFYLNFTNSKKSIDKESVITDKINNEEKQCRRKKNLKN